MASPLQFEVDLERKCDIDKVWECMKNATTVLPEAFPHKFDSFEVLEGGGIRAGTVHNAKFKPVARSRLFQLPSDHGTSLKWGCEFVKACEDVPVKADNIMADAVNLNQVLEAYILNKT